MKKNCLLILLIMIAGSAFSQTIDKPVAKIELYKTEIVSQKQLDSQYADYREMVSEIHGEEAVQGVTKKTVLENMIKEIILLQAAEKEASLLPQSDVDTYFLTMKTNVEKAGRKLSEDEYSKFMYEQSGMTLSVMKAQYKKKESIKMLVNKKRPDFAKKVSKPTAAEVEQLFNAQVNSGKVTRPMNFNFNHIYISTIGLDENTKKMALQLAQEILAEISGKKISFSAAARKYSEDSDSKYKGGNKGWVSVNDPFFTKYFGDKVMSIIGLKTGEVSGVVESKIGFHVILLSEIKSPGVPGIDEKIDPTQEMTYRQYLNVSLEKQKVEEAYARIIDEVYTSYKNDADITIFAPELQ